MPSFTGRQAGWTPMVRSAPERPGSPAAQTDQPNADDGAADALVANQAARVDDPAEGVPDLASRS
jgi:hypothetical protein